MKRLLTTCSLALYMSGCATAGNILNPFYESPTPEAYKGERSDAALHESRDKDKEARQALESMASYRRAQEPQPNNPVIQPAVVRLMWIPDHLNKSGDLVPAHYYYLKVLKDRWAVQDAFELEAQLGGSANATTNVPFVSEKDSKSY